MERTRRASFEFSLKWQSPFATHNDRCYAPIIDFWRDIFPGDMQQRAAALHTGGRLSETFAAGVLVPAFERKRIRTFDDRRFEKDQGGVTVVPALGRFYPQGFAWRALDCFRGDLNPMRIIGMADGHITADTNHPLAPYSLSLQAICTEHLGAAEQRGGTCNVIAEMVADNGPGMQAAYPGLRTDFYAQYPFRRKNEEDDRLFYANPRLVNHLDDTAIGHVKATYARLLPPGGRILDLMSSWVSHLPEAAAYGRVTGLGLNRTELEANAQLTDAVVHDLNRNPALPFDDNAFDAVICTASIEYLTRPLEVIEDVARVLAPGGLFITTFSDRWFPDKQILPWPELHPFERLGLVLDFCMQSNAFEDLHTESVRGWPRPSQDKYATQTLFSDPIFAVWGRSRKDASP